MVYPPDPVISLITNSLLSLSYVIQFLSSHFDNYLLTYLKKILNILIFFQTSKISQATMDVLHPQKPPQSSSSKLNPDAPIFVPMKSYQTVEDFSDKWWELVHSSPFFRDYWLQDCFDDVDDDLFHDDDDDFQDDDFFLPEIDAFTDIIFQKQEEKVKDEKKEGKELISMAALKWNESGGRTVEAPRYSEKVPKVVKSSKVSPRTINQPR